MKTPPPIKEKYIDTPDQLLELFEEYVAQVKPTTINVIHPKMGVVELTNDSPITIEGFSSWGRKVKDLTFRHYIYPQDKDSYKEFVPVVQYIRDFIYDRNFTGAACGKYKEQLIIRQLALKEHTEAKISGSLNIPNLPDIGDRKQV